MPRATSMKEGHVGMYIQLPRELHQRLKGRAKQEGRSMDAQAVRAIREHLDAMDGAQGEEDAPAPGA